MLKIAELYPNKVTKVAIADQESDKWSCALMSWNDGLLDEALFTLDGYTYNSDTEALDAMDSILTMILNSIKVMSN